MRPLLPFVVACLASMGGSAFGAGTTVVKLSDPQGDDHGPGEYQYPTDAQLYPRGSFDLTNFEVRVEGDDVVFEVTFARNITRPFVAKRTNASEIMFDNGIYIQNVDIYIDRVAGTGIGETEAVPGRNVTIDPDHAWDTAVVMTPQPYPTRSMLSEWKPANRVVFATNAVAVGPKVTARVGSVQLGGLPAASWGYQVLVTGATWAPSFDVVNRFVSDRGLNAFTMMVQTVPEPAAFGGGRLDYLNPFVIDMLAPEGVTQERILGGFDEVTQRLAVVPLVYPDAGAHRAAMVALGPTLVAKAPVPRPSRWMILTVRDVRDDMLILERKPEQKLEPYRLGDIIDREDQKKCGAVVTSVHEEFVVATAVKCSEKVAPGARVRFDARPAKKTEGEAK